MTLTEQIQFLEIQKKLYVLVVRFHNIMFMNEGKDIIIINKTYKLNKHQEIINQAKKPM